LQQRQQEHSLEKGKSLYYMVTGKLDIHMQKKETRLLPLTIYKKINSKWTKDVNYKYSRNTLGHLS
jgi:hypothetical protein